MIFGDIGYGCLKLGSHALFVALFSIAKQYKQGRRALGTDANLLE